MSYNTFLQSLDDSQLLSHIYTLSQVQEPSGLPDATSTPTNNNLSVVSTSSIGSDPFEDGLDSALLKIPFANDAANDAAHDSANDAANDSANDIVNDAVITRSWRSSFLGQHVSELESFQSDSSNVSIARNQLALVAADATEATDAIDDSTDDDMGNTEIHKDLDSKDDSNKQLNTKNFNMDHPKNDFLIDVLNEPSEFMAESEIMASSKDSSFPNFQTSFNPDQTNDKPANHHEEISAAQKSSNRADSDESESESDSNEKSNFGIVGPQHGFGDHHIYFENKHKKQLLADQVYIQWEMERRQSLGLSTHITQIFAHCSIFVNGNTTPTLDTIHKTVILHGGIFLSHLQNKGAASHIVCDRLTPRKRIEFKNYRVVKAKWIVDCVASGTLLDWKAYRLIEELEPYQKRLGYERVLAGNSEHEKDNDSGNDENDFEDDFENDSENDPKNDYIPVKNDPKNDSENDPKNDYIPVKNDPKNDSVRVENDFEDGSVPVENDFENDSVPVRNDPKNGPALEENVPKNVPQNNTVRVENDSENDPVPVKNVPLNNSVPLLIDYENDPENDPVPVINDPKNNPVPVKNAPENDPQNNSVPVKNDPKNDPKNNSIPVKNISENDPQFDHPRGLSSPHSLLPKLSQLNSARLRIPFAQMDAKHPDFLKHFFANSRLHHLSTWKADLRAKFLRIIAKGHQPPPKTSSHRQIILHIDFDCFFATASALKLPNVDISKDPVAVSHGGTSSDIASCNYVARDFGIRNGMWLGAARRLCPQLKVIDYDFDAYEKISHAFYTYLLGCRTFHAIFPVSIDEVLVDATDACYGPDMLEMSLEDSVSRLCADIRRQVVAHTGCTVSIGAAHNVLLAKLAIRKAKPDGVFTLLKDPQQFLDSVHFTDLPGVGRGLYEKLVHHLHQSDAQNLHQSDAHHLHQSDSHNLHQSDSHNLHQSDSHNLHQSDADFRTPILLKHVRELGLARLSAIFGHKTAVRIHENCNGIDHTQIHMDETSKETLGRKSVSVDVNYGIRFDTFVQAEAFLVRLAQELHSRMIDLGVCGSAVTLKLARKTADAPWITPKYMGLGKVNFFSKSGSLGVATNDWGILGSEMKSLFRMLNIPVQELRGISVTVTKLEDIDDTKRSRQRQRRLGFGKHAGQNREGRHKDCEKKDIIEKSQDLPFAEKIWGVDSIDWKVFNELPMEIRSELKKELLRRGIPVTAQEKNEKKGFQVEGKKESSSSNFSSSDGKVYYQQIFPSQTNGMFKTLKIKESPKKKRRLERQKVNVSSITPQVSSKIPNVSSTIPKVSSKIPQAQNHWTNYDEEVLKEIPTLIREQFMQDVERLKKHQKLEFVSIKEKIEKKEQYERKIRQRVISETWLRSQPRLVAYDGFNGESLPVHALVSQIRRWVVQSIGQEGPHLDDVAIFRTYLNHMLEKGNISRCVCLVQAIESELSTQNTIMKVSCVQDTTIICRGISDWRVHIDSFRGLIDDFCSVRRIDVN